MALYSIDPPLIKHLRTEYPNVLHLWYADNGAMHEHGFRVALA